MQGISPFQDRLHEIAGILADVSPYLEVLDFLRIRVVCKSWRERWIPSLPRRLPKEVEKTTVGEVLLSNGGRDTTEELTGIPSIMWRGSFLEETVSLVAVDFDRLVPGDWVVLWGKYEASGHQGHPRGNLELRNPIRGDFIPGERQKKAFASLSCIAATFSKVEEEKGPLCWRSTRAKFYLGFLFGPTHTEMHELSECISVTSNEGMSYAATIVQKVLVVRREDRRTGLHPFGN